MCVYLSEHRQDLSWKKCKLNNQIKKSNLTLQNHKTLDEDTTDEKDRKMVAETDEFP